VRDLVDPAIDQVPGDRHQVRLQRVAALHHVLEERTAEHVADVDVAHLHDAQAVEGAVEPGSRTASSSMTGGAKPGAPVGAEPRRHQARPAHRSAGEELPPLGGDRGRAVPPPAPAVHPPQQMEGGEDMPR